MKKISLLIIVTLTHVVLFAQNEPKFGIRGGLNVAATNNTVTGQTGSKAGLHAGFIAHVHLTPQISLQPEIYYSNQGGKSGNTNLNLNYINVPVLVQYNFDNGFRLQTGPQIGLLVDVNDKTDGQDNDIISSD
ncbi:MAG TPA: porin family protein, partial [Niastella sp.]|nr:porin family protein [Niastella sp.]